MLTHFVKNIRETADLPTSLLNLLIFILIWLVSVKRGGQSPCEIGQGLQGHSSYFSGDEHCRGAGQVVHRNVHAQLGQMIFQFYTSRACVLQFAYGNPKKGASSCYCPTTQVYEFIRLLFAGLSWKNGAFF